MLTRWCGLGVLVLGLCAGCSSHRVRTAPPQQGPYPFARAQVQRPPASAVAAPLPLPPPGPAIFVPRPAGPSWFPLGRPISNRWTTIVLHHSATERGSAAMFDRDHRGRGWDELGYHFVIGNGRGAGDGQIEVGTRWNAQKHGAHCKTPDNYFNEHGIGICLVGDFTRSRPTSRQLTALQQLLTFLCSQCRIRPDRVVSHGAVTGRTACPGRFFPVQNIRRAVSAAAGGRYQHWETGLALAGRGKYRKG